MSKTNKKNMRNRNQITPAARATQLISVFQNQLCLGYSEDTWAKATSLLLEIGTLVDLNSYHRLGAVMRDAYVNPNLQNVITECESVSYRLQKR
jgi:hypothetical protein